MPVRRCATCATPLAPQSGRGRPRWYCSVRCRRMAEFAHRREVAAQRRAVHGDYLARLFNLNAR